MRGVIIVVLFFVFQILILNQLCALQTHDVSGLGSDIWSLSYDKLAEKIQSKKIPNVGWSVRLVAPDAFPFEVKWNDERICFQAPSSSGQNSSIVFYPAFNVPLSASKTATCCFTTDYKALMESGVEKNYLKEIILEPKLSKNVEQSSDVIFQVRSPSKILREFSCSPIRDEMDKYAGRKAHAVSLAEIDSALGDSLSVHPDPL